MTRDDWVTFLNAFLSNFRLTEYSTIYILYTQIVKVFRLPWELNILLSNFGLWALYSRTYWNSWPSPPAYCIPQQRYWHGTVRRQWKVRFNLRKELRPSPFTHLAILSTYAEYCSVMSRIAYCLLIHWLISVHDWRAADGFLPSDWLNGLTVMIGKIISVLWLAYCNSFLCLPNWFFLVIGWQFSVVWQANGHVLCNGSTC